MTAKFGASFRGAITSPWLWIRSESGNVAQFTRHGCSPLVDCANNLGIRMKLLDPVSATGRKPTIPQIGLRGRSSLLRIPRIERIWEWNWNGARFEDFFIEWLLENRATAAWECAPVSCGAHHHFMITSPRPNLYESSDGFSVEVLGLTGLRYREAGRRMFVDPEILAGPDGMAICKDTIASWKRPHESFAVADLDRERILKNIRDTVL